MQSQNQPNPDGGNANFPQNDLAHPTAPQVALTQNAEENRGSSGAAPCSAIAEDFDGEIPSYISFTNKTPMSKVFDFISFLVSTAQSEYPNQRLSLSATCSPAVRGVNTVRFHSDNHTEKDGPNPLDCSTI